MKSYFIALIDINDMERYRKYLEGYDVVFEKYKGKVLAVDDNPEVLEGSWPSKRTVVIEFPDENELKRWYLSKEYQKLAKHRKEASVASIAIIKGRG